MNKRAAELLARAQSAKSVMILTPKQRDIVRRALAADAERRERRARKCTRS